eukprot:1130413-Prorocentrum_minimum.AAC.2
MDALDGLLQALTEAAVHEKGPPRVVLPGDRLVAERQTAQMCAHRKSERLRLRSVVPPTRALVSTVSGSLLGEVGLIV